ncbi:MAG: hypothetical protein H7329_01425 [Opitutaceae bacterium]|nr:hypothetical protein [Cytophagales bacterium]
MKFSILTSLLCLCALVATSQSIVPDAISSDSASKVMLADSLLKQDRARQVIIDYHQQKEKYYDKEIEQLKQRLMDVEDEVAYTRINLAHAHSKFRRGVLLIAGGTGFFLLGTLIQYTNVNVRRRGRGGSISQATTVSNAFYLGGVITISVGVTICIDSHKYFGRAAKKFPERNLLF